MNPTGKEEFEKEWKEDHGEEWKHYSDHPETNLICNLFGMTEEEVLQAQMDQLRKEYRD